MYDDYQHFWDFVICIYLVAVVPCEFLTCIRFSMAPPKMFFNKSNGSYIKIKKIKSNNSTLEVSQNRKLDKKCF